MKIVAQKNIQKSQIDWEAIRKRMILAGFQVGYKGQTSSQPEPVANLILDEFSQSPVIGLAVHKLSNSWTGDCMVIRRSSDNATQSIGFSGNDIDEAAISSFVGANSAYVQTWFDQTGNGNHVVQDTTTWQPMIVNSGTIEKNGGKVALYFDGTDDRLLGPVGCVSSKDIKFATCIMQPELHANFGSIMSTKYDDANGFWLGKNNSNSYRMQNWFRANNNTTSAYDFVLLQQNIVSWKFSVGTLASYRWLNGQVDANLTYSDLGSSTTIFRFDVGGGGGTGAGYATEYYPWKGYIQDLVIWNHEYNATTDKTNIESAFTTYFNM